mgnify:CR=1 FL=1
MALGILVLAFGLAALLARERVEVQQLGWAPTAPAGPPAGSRQEPPVPAAGAGRVPGGAAVPAAGPAPGAEPVATVLVTPLAARTPEAGPGAALAGLDDLLLEREQRRAMLLEELRVRAEDAEAPETDRARARERLMALLAVQVKESELEYLLAYRGYEGRVFLDGEAASVVVARTLGSADAMAVGELVARVSGVRRERVAILDGATLAAAPRGGQENP